MARILLYFAAVTRILLYFGAVTRILLYFGAVTRILLYFGAVTRTSVHLGTVTSILAYFERPPLIWAAKKSKEIIVFWLKYLYPVGHTCTPV